MKSALLVIVGLLVNTGLFAANSVQVDQDDSTIEYKWPFPDDFDDEES